jgi:ubiquinone/menaquinone biosynthesis C-methylase UbiE
MRGATLMVAAGTGNDFRFFPSGQSIIAIDISRKMLERAAQKAATYEGSLELRQMDVTQLEFPDNTFDTLVTVCTFCSVPRPIAGLRELHRVLKPEGQILMFEHVRSRIGPLGIMLDLMTPLSRRLGPDLNRDTVGNVQKAGFRIAVRKTSTSTSSRSSRLSKNPAEIQGGDEEHEIYAHICGRQWGVAFPGR